MSQGSQYSSDAHAALEECLARVRSLLELALREQQYGELAALGSLADGLSSLLQRISPGRVDVDDLLREATDLDADLSPDVLLSQRRLAKKGGRRVVRYPRFERNGRRLVKVGWSKRDSTEYEHKAPRAAVNAVVKALAEITKGQFTMDEVLPIRDDAGSDVPSYQAYLVVGWLRSIGAVERIGNDGYKVRRDLLTPAAIERVWADLKVQPGAMTDVE
jgi:hypothetical protein